LHRASLTPGDERSSPPRLSAPWFELTAI
jgi:hypothetical protein